MKDRIAIQEKLLYAYAYTYDSKEHYDPPHMTNIVRAVVAVRSRSVEPPRAGTLKYE
jgi:hypothetical protein